MRGIPYIPAKAETEAMAEADVCQSESRFETRPTNGDWRHRAHDRAIEDIANYIRPDLQ